MIVPAQLIDDLLSTGSEAAMMSVIAAADNQPFSPENVYRLAQGMAISGQTVSSAFPSADLASTGGPGSLSTLLVPLYLRTAGYIVPKLGVPGRPAGGIDVLAQLRSYRFRLSSREIDRILESYGYVHFLANEDFAPLDAVFFRYRQKVGAQSIPSLAAASLLAKKIACGLKLVGLDVRVAPHGNFGRDLNEARKASELFCEAAAIAGIRAVAILTDARFPYQPYIGRGEALLATKYVVEGRADDWLLEHNHRCRLMAEQVAALGRIPNRTGLSLQAAFLENIEAQGSSSAELDEVVARIESAQRINVCAESDGFVLIDVGGIRSVIEDAHQRMTDQSRFPDCVGVILRVKPGSYVYQGDVLASVRAPEAVWNDIRVAMTKCFKSTPLLDYAPGLEVIARA